MSCALLRAVFSSMPCIPQSCPFNIDAKSVSVYSPSAVTSVQQCDRVSSLCGPLLLCRVDTCANCGVDLFVGFQGMERPDRGQQLPHHREGSSDDSLPPMRASCCAHQLSFPPSRAQDSAPWSRGPVRSRAGGGAAGLVGAGRSALRPGPTCPAGSGLYL